MPFLPQGVVAMVAAMLVASAPAQTEEMKPPATQVEAEAQPKAERQPKRQDAAAGEESRQPDKPAAPDDLVDVQRLIPDLVLDLRYATADNFIGEQVYPDDARCYLRRAVAERLARVAKALREEDGTRLRVFDCYRPLSVQKKMWAIFPRPGYVANPKTGSIHNRGGAVDLTLASPDGEALPMPTDFDTFEEKAWQGYRGEGVSAERIANRERLRKAMQAQGFRTIRKEWWHYVAPEGRSYPVMDLGFDELERKAK